MFSAGPNAFAGGQSPTPQPGLSAGQAQTGDATTKLAMEIDQACKLLIQAMPSFAPQIAQFIVALRQAVAENAANPNANLTPADSGSFPDGSARLSGGL